MSKALFPGSFDPFTAGHLNILKRALTMFDEVVVAVGINQDKRGFFDMDQRLDIIGQAVKGIEGVSIIKYDNLTVDKCRELGIRHIVRGVRNMIDFETERSIADANRSSPRMWRPSSSLQHRSLRISRHRPCATSSAITGTLPSSSAKEWFCLR